MDMIAQYLPLLAMMMITGAAAGVLAGLLGVGGGIVIVPALELALGVLGVDPAIRMHVAVATSLATIILTSISSARAHHRKGGVDFSITKFWGPFIFIGAVAGVLLATRLESSVLSLVFAVVALLVACKMMLPLDGVVLCKTVPRSAVGSLPPFFIGALSSMIGIGGGSLSVPALTLMNQGIHRAIGTAALFGLLISFPATIAFIVTGLGDPRLPSGSLGYVNLPGFAMIAPLTVLTAPLGVKLAHRLDKRQLNLLFGSFLLLVSLRMLYRSFMA